MSINNFGWAFISSFSDKYVKIKRLIFKYWDIIKNDRILGQHVSDKPPVIFQKGYTLREKIAPNLVDKPVKPAHLKNLKGFITSSSVVCKIVQLNSVQSNIFFLTGYPEDILDQYFYDLFY